MKLFLILLSVSFVFASSTPAEAARSTKAKKSSLAKKNAATKAAKEQLNLNTKHNFDDHGVTGEYQVPDEALAKVENEKSLTDLLGIRKHFKDRLAEASEQE